jgi:ABC-type phosphate/phosphonate transport system substrate-binding protein
MKRRNIKIRRSGLLGLYMLLTCFPITAQELRTAADSQFLRFGLSRDLFREFNAVDGVTATKVWLETMVRDRHIIAGSDTFLFENPETIARAVREHTFDIALMLAVEYLDVADTDELREWFTYRRGGEPGQKLVVLVNADSGYHSVKDLEEKRIVVFGGEQTEIAKFWLGVQTLMASGKDIDSYFQSVEEVNKPTKAVLPVFFGRRDACLVTEEAFAVAAELNPQVGQRLRPIEESESFASVVLCAHRDSDPEMLKRVYDAFAAAHLDPKAKQVFVTYRLDKLDPIEPAMLESVRRVKRQYQELKASSRMAESGNDAAVAQQTGGQVSE